MASESVEAGANALGAETVDDNIPARPVQQEKPVSPSSRGQPPISLLTKDPRRRGDGVDNPLVEKLDIISYLSEFVHD
ncbi:unnamed protein product, partial [Ectocarpus fasciculatus]